MEMIILAVGFTVGLLVIPIMTMCGITVFKAIECSFNIAIAIIMCFLFAVTVM